MDLQLIIQTTHLEKEIEESKKFLNKKKQTSLLQILLQMIKFK